MRLSPSNGSGRVINGVRPQCGRYISYNLSKLAFDFLVAANNGNCEVRNWILLTSVLYSPVRQNGACTLFMESCIVLWSMFKCGVGWNYEVKQSA